MNLDKIVTRNV